jgi:hypothetical protein
MALIINRKAKANLDQKTLPLMPVTSSNAPKATPAIKAKAVTLDDVFGTAEPVKEAKAPMYPSALGELHGIGPQQRVVITNDKFPWITAYKPGDTGVVSRLHDQKETAKTYPCFDPSKDAMYEVVLDEPRTNIKKLDFPRWAIEPIAAVHRIGGVS